MLAKPFFILAPMDDVTDMVFRQIIVKCAKPDLFMTEFVNVDGYQSPGKHKLEHKFWFKKTEAPIIAQLWGKDPKNYQKTAKELVKKGFAGIDINMGCPDKAVVKNGCGSALINNRPLAAEIIAAVKNGVDGEIPVSVKLRTGFSKVDLSWPEFILKQGIDMLTVHGRTTKEMSGPPARWEDIAAVREIRDKIAPNTMIVGNGDVTSRAEGEELAKKYKLDGIMIGRGVFADPFVFAKQSPWPAMSPALKAEYFIQHIQLFDKTYKNNERNIQTLRKFAKTYLNGFAGAAELRSKVYEQNSIEGMIKALASLS